MLVVVGRGGVGGGWFPQKLCSQHICTCCVLSSLIGIPRPLANTAGHDSARSHVEDTQTHANTHMQSCTTACPDLIAIATETSACVRCYLGSPCETVHICLSVKQRGSVREIDTRHTSCYRHGGVGGGVGACLAPSVSSPAFILLFSPFAPISLCLSPSVSLSPEA